MRADRLLAIMLRLQTRTTLTTQALADELGVSRRTILRDIDALCAAGVPVFTQSGQGGGVGLDEAYCVALTGLRAAEVQALFLSGNLKPLAELGLDSAADSLLLKFFATLPTLQQELVRRLQQRVYIDSTWWIADDAPPALSAVLEAVNHDRQLHITYQRRDGQISERILHPYGLVAKGGMWYLVALREYEWRTYRVSRMQQVTILEAPFQRRTDFDLQRHWRTAMGELFDAMLQYRFTLRIHTRRQEFVRRYSTGRYEVIAADDGTGWFTARFAAESIEAALMLSFGLGADAEIVEPQELLDELRVRCRALQ
jgi:predicted DNA-binding transcriptional regulator YafY